VLSCLVGNYTMLRRFVIGAALAACLVTARPLFAQVTLQPSLVASGFSAPVFVTGAPGDTTHLYILEKGSGTTATIKVHNLVTHATSTFLTLNGVATSGEQGLLGLAFDPNYATNGNFYIHYNATTTQSGVSSVSTIAAYHANNATQANATALGTLLRVNQTPDDNHKGGWIGFSSRAGDANNLYIALGDGGGSNDSGTGHVTGGNAQSTANLLGKILRINVDSANPNAYTIPANNPFASSVDPNVRKEIFTFGLRNPYRASFDRGNGDLYIGDVGQGAREEIDVQKASNAGGGENYGWRLREGTITTPTVGGDKTPEMTDPIIDYPRTSGGTLAGRTVIGGYVYRGTAIPELVGTYIFGDYRGPAGDDEYPQIFSLKYDGTTVSAVQNLTSMLNPGGATTPLIPALTSFGEDTSGELYMVDAGTGQIYKIVAVPEPASLILMTACTLLLFRRRRA
jgi:glucose/arabinose dehydrogenase